LKDKAIATFSRGFTNGYLKPSPDDEMFARTSSGVKGDIIDDIQEEVKEKDQEFSSYRRNNIDFDIILKIGDKAILKASDGKNTVTVKSKEICETSEKNTATEEMIEEQIGKLGNTIYNLNNLNILKDDNVFVRKST